MKKYFGKTKLHLRGKNDEKVLLVKQDGMWHRIGNDGSDRVISIANVYREIFKIGGYDRATKRRAYTPALLNYSQAILMLKKGFVLRDKQLNAYQQKEDGSIFRNGKKVIAISPNGVFIVDILRERVADEAPVQTKDEKIETKIQGDRPRLRKARPLYKPDTTRVCMGDEHKELQELKADLEMQERKKVPISAKSEEEGNFFWDFLLPIAAGGVGVGILWKLIKETNNNHINKLAYV